jgi:5,10-methylenetetrahydrofolate reductase
MSLSDRLRAPQPGVCFYGLAPPKRSTPPERLAAIASAQLSRLAELQPDGLVVYDLQDEPGRTHGPRPFPFLPTLEPERYAYEALGSVQVPRIVYRSVAAMSRASFIEWLRAENARPQEPFAVLVGAPGALTPGALSLDEAYALAREHAPRLVLGGVAIAERHARKGDEHLRLMKKQQAGCRFFVTQTVYDASATRSLISDYARATRKAGLAPAPLIFTFSPCGSVKTLELLKWLGVGVPRWLENELLDAHDILQTSLELSRATFADVLEYAGTHQLPAGANVESVAVRKEEIEASVDLFRSLRAQLRGSQRRGST